MPPRKAEASRTAEAPSSDTFYANDTPPAMPPRTPEASNSDNFYAETIRRASYVPFTCRSLSPSLETDELSLVADVEMWTRVDAQDGGGVRQLAGRQKHVKNDLARLERAGTPPTHAPTKPFVPRHVQQRMPLTRVEPTPLTREANNRDYVSKETFHELQRRHDALLVALIERVDLIEQVALIEKERGASTTNKVTVGTYLNKSDTADLDYEGSGIKVDAGVTPAAAPYAPLVSPLLEADELSLVVTVGSTVGTYLDESRMAALDYEGSGLKDAGVTPAAAPYAPFLSPSLEADELSLVADVGMWTRTPNLELRNVRSYL